MAAVTWLQRNFDVFFFLAMEALKMQWTEEVVSKDEKVAVGTLSELPWMEAENDTGGPTRFNPLFGRRNFKQAISRSSTGDPSAIASEDFLKPHSHDLSAYA